MTHNDILILKAAGIVKDVHENKILHVSDGSIKYIYLLQRGLIKISYIADSGWESIKYIVKPGDLFGEFNLLENEKPRNEIAISLEQSEVCFIPVDTVKPLMLKNSSLQHNINLLLSKRIRQMEDRVLSLSLKDVKERVMDFLNEFVAEFGQPISGGLQARNFLTHDDIAKITTTSRQSVTSSLCYFKKQGLIDYDARYLRVFDAAKYSLS